MFRLSDNFIVGGYGPASGFPGSWCRRSHGNTFLVVSSSNRFFWYWNPVHFSLLSPSDAFFLSLYLHPRMEMTRVLFSLVLLLCAWYKEWGASTCCLSLLSTFRRQGEAADCHQSLSDCLGVTQVLCSPQSEMCPSPLFPLAFTSSRPLLVWIKELHLFCACSTCRKALFLFRPCDDINLPASIGRCSLGAHCEQRPDCLGVNAISPLPAFLPAETLLSFSFLTFKMGVRTPWWGEGIEALLWRWRN